MRPSENMLTPYEAYLEQENSRLKAENEYFRNRDEMKYVPLSAVQGVHEETIEARSVDMVKIAKLTLKRSKDLRGYAVHIFTPPIGLSPEYSAIYMIDEISASGVNASDIVNYVLPKMHEKFVKSLSAHFRKMA